MATDPKNARLLLVRAGIDDRRGDWRRALTFAERVLADDPRQFEALNLHGFVSAEHQYGLPLAIRRLQSAIALDPGAGGIVDSLGWAYFKAGDLPRATDFLEQADRLEPGDPEILGHLGDLWVKKNDPARAKATYHAALSRSPPDKLARELEARLRTLESTNAAGR